MRVNSSNIAICKRSHGATGSALSDEPTTDWESIPTKATWETWGCAVHAGESSEEVQLRSATRGLPCAGGKTSIGFLSTSPAHWILTSMRTYQDTQQAFDTLDALNKDLVYRLSIAIDNRQCRSVTLVKPQRMGLRH